MSVHPKLEAAYRFASEHPSDIQNHVPRLRDLASNCQSVTEFGTRSAVSTVAILRGQPGKFVAYDIHKCPRAIELTPIAGATKFEFVVGDTRKISIEPTDMLFIDTLHTYEQLSAELARHSDKVGKWIAMHDTVTFGDRGELPNTKGLRPAINEFLAKGGWTVEAEYEDSNGLTVLKRTT